MPNIIKNLPHDLTAERFETIASGRNTRIERIVSNGHTTPMGTWYDPTQTEWVLVLEGRGDIEFEDDRSETLHKGDYLVIKPHQRHRVTHTDPNTVWVAVHFD